MVVSEKMMMPEEYPLSKPKEQTDRKTRPLSFRSYSIELGSLKKIIREKDLTVEIWTLRVIP